MFEDAIRTAECCSEGDVYRWRKNGWVQRAGGVEPPLAKQFFECSVATICSSSIRSLLCRLLRIQGEFIVRIKRRESPSTALEPQRESCKVR